MKRIVTRRQVGLFSAVLASCLLLSSCTFGANSADAGIKKAVAAYLDVIADGTLTDDEYESEFADDTAFADLEFADDEVTPIMDKGFTKIEYTIDAVSGSVKDEEGSCDVTVTAIDVEEVLAGLEDVTLDADTLMDAVKDKKAPTKDYEITLDVTYDSKDKVWRIADSSPLVEILGDPYTEITFGPAAGDPTTVVDTFMTALAQGDAATIDLISPYYDSTNFFDEDAAVMPMVLSFYSKITYEVVGDPTVTETTADVNVAMTLPDIAAIINVVSNDVDFMASVFKPYVLASIQDTDTTQADEQATAAFSDKVAEILNSSDIPTLKVDSIFQLEVNQETQAWNLYEIPTELYDIDSEPTISDEMSMEAAGIALDELYQEGSIDKATYDQYMAELTGTTVATETTLASAANSPETDITFAKWYDYYTKSYVTEYDSTTTYTIEYDIEFANEWPGLVIYYDYYNENGTVLIKSSSETMQSGQYDVYVLLETEDGSTIPPDVYTVILYLEDETILATDTVTVY